MEISIYSFEGTMELNEWFQWLEEYFDYANIQNEQDTTLTATLHLTGQAYAWVRRNYEYWNPSFTWDTFENFREKLEFEEKWNYKERKALELEYKEEAWEVEDDDSEFETINIEFKVGKYMEEKIAKSVATTRGAPTRAHLHAIRDRNQDHNERPEPSRNGDNDSQIEQNAQRIENNRREYLRNVSSHDSHMKAPKILDSLSWKNKKNNHTMRPEDAELI
eukprot:Gb_06179 [translate_table: standard]